MTPEARGYLSFGPSKQFTLAGRLKFGTLLAPDNDTYKSNLGKVAAAAETTRLKTDPGLFKKLFGAKRPS